MDLPTPPNFGAMASTSNLSVESSEWNCNSNMADNEQGFFTKDLLSNGNSRMALNVAHAIGLPNFSKSFIDQLYSTSNDPSMTDIGVGTPQYPAVFAEYDFALPPLPVKEPVKTHVNRRTNMQKNLTCSKCHDSVGTALIRGNKDSQISVDLVCNNCDLSKPVTSAPSRKRRKTDITKVECEVCKIRLGSGGVKVLEEDLKLEYICCACDITYMFCSECGGGGKQRTGKWRPKELFENGRRTCSLPHIRVGTVPIHYQVINLEDITAPILQGIQDVFFDCYLSLYCLPTLMANPQYATYAHIRREIERLWKTSVLDVISQSPTGDTAKYITLAWIQKRHRNKGSPQKSSPTTKDMLPWLKRLHFDNVVSSDVPESSQSECFIAFNITEWSPSKKSVVVTQVAPRSVFLKTMDGYLELMKTVIDKIKADAASSSQEPPLHIVCWARQDHARLACIPSRLRFSLLSAYLCDHPELNPSLVDRDFLTDSNNSTFAASIQDVFRV